jgi:3-oxoacyl-[acyl-carrier-protein] synthase II
MRHAYVSAAAHVADEPGLERLSADLAVSVDRLARTDALVRLALAAIARLQREGETLRGAGIVVGSALATLETNALFAARIRERGALAAEPRRFPYTSPNVVAGECAIAFGLTGPAFSVGGGSHAALEAMAAGALLVEGGDAERMVVVAVDDAGPVTSALAGRAITSGAVAVLLSSSKERARARVGALQIVRGARWNAAHAAHPPSGAYSAGGHQALLPLVSHLGPGELSCSSPPDALARVRLEPV